MTSNGDGVRAGAPRRRLVPAVRRALLALAVAVMALAPFVAAPAAQAATAHAAVDRAGKPAPSPTVTPAPTASPSGGSVDCLDQAQAAAAGGACDQVEPTFACVFNNGNGSYTAALGYVNSSPYTLELPVGSYLNSFYGKKGDPNDWGQPALYPPGTSVTAFTVTWTQPWQYTIEWELGGTKLSFSSASTPACTTHPVPIVGSVAAIGGAVVLGAAIFGWANRRAVRKIAASRAV